ncbi:progestin and adipoQ receptor family member 3 isoform X2 [Chrysoperla carnea]|uniref:progestin and adipoQ receptor family member 3 isoform X2 n=1 Tax=Chrysoperla carnea TaxID=189513 RepID=UPI001D08DA77|nr:progestin and adipoQ receptor family member 3 isoform X2 [Chrysoperla carnea]
MDGDNSSTAATTTDCCSSASQQCCDSQEHMTKVKSLLDTALRQRFVTRDLYPNTEQIVNHLTKCMQSDRDKDNNSNDNNKEENKLYKLLRYEDAPEYLQFNPYIRSGYRQFLNTKLCLESIFWWTNETINIWSHLFGFLLFFGLTIYDLCLLNIQAPLGDKLLVGAILICFQICMILSAMYHTFSCKSEHDFNCLLTFDLFGIAISLLSIYVSGIYYAFWCNRDAQYFYMISVSLIFIFALSLQVPRFNVSSNVKMLVFVAWAAYGVIPTLHWTFAQGGLKNPMVALLLPRVLGMYGIVGLAFLIYISKIPERFLPGYVDYIGHSHQWWHLFVVIALYYWHNSGMIYIEYRMNHACSDNLRLP